MTEIHRYVGYVVVAIFTIGWLFGLALWISRREAGDWFWRWLVGAQVGDRRIELSAAFLFLQARSPREVSCLEILSRRF